MDKLTTAGFTGARKWWLEHKKSGVYNDELITRAVPQSRKENTCLTTKQAYYLHVIRFHKSSFLQICDFNAKGILKPAVFLKQLFHGRSLYYEVPLDLQ